MNDFLGRKIIVIGAQRSGTNIASAIISNQTGIKLYSERDFGYSSCVIGNKPNDDLIHFIKNTDEYILQAPALNSYCHLIDGDVFFVWVVRVIEEIRASRKRSGWPGEEVESAKYRKYHPILSFTDTVDASINAWKYQKNMVNHIEFNYSDFSDSPLWKSERSSLGIGDT